MDKDQKQDSDIRKQGPSQESDTSGQDKQQQDQQDQQLRKEDLPDSTNESRGNTGSGQRQDSN
jgi:hypothetical protein